MDRFFDFYLNSTVFHLFINYSNETSHYVIAGCD